MTKPKITGHCLVRNEERWVWFAIMSVIDYLDELLVWDTGSQDKTVQIIKLIKNPKIKFREVGQVASDEFPKVRQAMIEETKSDWIFILDGDEVWTKAGIGKVIETVRTRGEKIESILVHYYNLIGDVYHYQEEEAGRYEMAGRRGHITIRAMSTRIPGLHAGLPYGREAFFDGSGKLIQERNPEKIAFLDDVYYLHLTHLHRSSKDAEVPLRKRKLKYELGKAFPKDFSYPEVFYLDRPSPVPSPWIRRSKGYFLRAAIQTPFKKIRRRLLWR